MTDTDKQKTGKIGEDLACLFLKKRNFKIIDRNYRRPWGEIDIVAEKEGLIHFVEVKTVSRENIFAGRAGDLSDDYEPEDNIHPWKRRRLKRIIQTYLLGKKIDDEVDWRVDAISVYLDKQGRELKIDWLEDIVL